MDTIKRGAIAGFIATALYAVVSSVIYALGFLPFMPIHYNAIFITPPGTPYTTALPLVMGTITLFITGMLVAVFIGFVTYFTGTDLAWLKGTAVGMVLWPVHSKLIPAIDPELFEVYPLSMVLASLIYASLWGLLVGFILQYYLPAKN